MDSLLNQLNQNSYSTDELRVIVQKAEKLFKKSPFPWIDFVKTLVTHLAVNGSEVLYHNVLQVMNSKTALSLKTEECLPKKEAEAQIEAYSSLLTHISHGLEESDVTVHQISKLIAVILPTCIDLKVKLAKKDKAAVGEKIYSKVTTLLGWSPELLIDCLLHCKTLIYPTIRQPDIYIPIIRKVFSTLKSQKSEISSMSPVLYMKYLVLGKFLLFMSSKEEVPNIRQEILKLMKLPLAFDCWAKQIDIPFLKIKKLDTKHILHAMTISTALQALYSKRLQNERKDKILGREVCEENIVYAKRKELGDRTESKSKKRKMIEVNGISIGETENQSQCVPSSVSNIVGGFTGLEEVSVIDEKAHQVENQLSHRKKEKRKKNLKKLSKTQTIEVKEVNLDMSEDNTLAKPVELEGKLNEKKDMPFKVSLDTSKGSTLTEPVELQGKLVVEEKIDMLSQECVGTSKGSEPVELEERLLVKKKKKKNLSSQVSLDSSEVSALAKPVKLEEKLIAMKKENLDCLSQECLDTSKVSTFDKPVELEEKKLKKKKKKDLPSQVSLDSCDQSTVDKPSELEEKLIEKKKDVPSHSILDSSKGNTLVEPVELEEKKIKKKKKNKNKDIPSQISLNSGKQNKSDEPVELSEKKFEKKDLPSQMILDLGEQSILDEPSELEEQLIKKEKKKKKKKKKSMASQVSLDSCEQSKLDEPSELEEKLIIKKKDMPSQVSLNSSKGNVLAEPVELEEKKLKKKKKYLPSQVSLDSCDQSTVDKPSELEEKLIKKKKDMPSQSILDSSKENTLVEPVETEEKKIKKKKKNKNKDMPSQMSLNSGEQNKSDEPVELEEKLSKKKFEKKDLPSQMILDLSEQSILDEPSELEEQLIKKEKKKKKKKKKSMASQVSLDSCEQSKLDEPSELDEKLIMKKELPSRVSLDSGEQSTLDEPVELKEMLIKKKKKKSEFSHNSLDLNEESLSTEPKEVKEKVKAKNKNTDLNLPSDVIRHSSEGRIEQEKKKIKLNSSFGVESGLGCSLVNTGALEEILKEKEQKIHSEESLDTNKAKSGKKNKRSSLESNLHCDLNSSTATSPSKMVMPSMKMLGKEIVTSSLISLATVSAGSPTECAIDKKTNILNLNDDSLVKSSSKKKNKRKRKSVAIEDSDYSHFFSESVDRSVSPEATLLVECSNVEVEREHREDRSKRKLKPWATNFVLNEMPAKKRRICANSEDPEASSLYSETAMQKKGIETDLVEVASDDHCIVKDGENRGPTENLMKTPKMKKKRKSHLESSVKTRRKENDGSDNELLEFNDLGTGSNAKKERKSLIRKKEERVIVKYQMFDVHDKATLKTKKSRLSLPSGNPPRQRLRTSSWDFTVTDLSEENLKRFASKAECKGSKEGSLANESSNNSLPNLEKNNGVDIPMNKPEEKCHYKEIEKDSSPEEKESDKSSRASNSDLEIVYIEKEATRASVEHYENETSDKDEASGSDGDIIPCDENNKMFTEEETKKYHQKVIEEQLEEKVQDIIRREISELKASSEKLNDSAEDEGNRFNNIVSQTVKDSIDQLNEHSEIRESDTGDAIDMQLDTDNAIDMILDTIVKDTGKRSSIEGLKKNLQCSDQNKEDRSQNVSIETLRVKTNGPRTLSTNSENLIPDETSNSSPKIENLNQENKLYENRKESKVLSDNHDGNECDDLKEQTSVFEKEKVTDFVDREQNKNIIDKNTSVSEPLRELDGNELSYANGSETSKETECHMHINENPDEVKEKKMEMNECATSQNSLEDLQYSTKSGGNESFESNMKGKSDPGCSNAVTLMSPKTKQIHSCLDQSILSDSGELEIYNSSSKEHDDDDDIQSSDGDVFIASNEHHHDVITASKEHDEDVIITSKEHDDDVIIAKEVSDTFESQMTDASKVLPDIFDVLESRENVSLVQGTLEKTVDHISENTVRDTSVISANGNILGDECSDYKDDRTTGNESTPRSEKRELFLSDISDHVTKEKSLLVSISDVEEDSQPLSISKSEDNIMCNFNNLDKYSEGKEIGIVCKLQSEKNSIFDANMSQNDVCKDKSTHSQADTPQSEVSSIEKPSENGMILLEDGDEAYEASSDASEEPVPILRRKTRLQRKSSFHADICAEISDSDLSPLKESYKRKVINERERISVGGERSLSDENNMMKEIDGEKTDDNDVDGAISCASKDAVAISKKDESTICENLSVSVEASRVLTRRRSRQSFSDSEVLKTKTQSGREISSKDELNGDVVKPGSSELFSVREYSNKVLDSNQFTSTNAPESALDVSKNEEINNGELKSDGNLESVGKCILDKSQKEVLDVISSVENMEDEDEQLCVHEHKKLDDENAKISMDIEEGDEIEVLSTSGVDEDEDSGLANISSGGSSCSSDQKKTAVVEENLKLHESTPRRISSRLSLGVSKKDHLTSPRKDTSKVDTPQNLKLHESTPRRISSRLSLGVSKKDHLTSPRKDTSKVEIPQVQHVSEAVLAKEILISPEVSDEECELVSPGLANEDSVLRKGLPVTEELLDPVEKLPGKSKVGLSPRSLGFIRSPQKVIPEEQDESKPRRVRTLSKGSSQQSPKDLKKSPSFIETNTNKPPTSTPKKTEVASSLEKSMKKLNNKEEGKSCQTSENASRNSLDNLKESPNMRRKIVLKDPDNECPGKVESHDGSEEEFENQTVFSPKMLRSRNITKSKHAPNNPAINKDNVQAEHQIQSTSDEDAAVRCDDKESTKEICDDKESTKENSSLPLLGDHYRRSPLKNHDNLRSKKEILSERESNIESKNSETDSSQENLAPRFLRSSRRRSTFTTSEIYTDSVTLPKKSLGCRDLSCKETERNTKESEVSEVEKSESEIENSVSKELEAKNENCSVRRSARLRNVVVKEPLTPSKRTRHNKVSSSVSSHDSDCPNTPKKDLTDLPLRKLSVTLSSPGKTVKEISEHVKSSPSRGKTPLFAEEGDAK